MAVRSDAGPIRTIFIDADGRPTDDPSRAVRGEVVEVAPDGSIVADYRSLAWSVDPGSLQGNEGELATRPRRAAAGEHQLRVVLGNAVAILGQTRLPLRRDLLAPVGELAAVSVCVDDVVAEATHGCLLTRRCLKRSRVDVLTF